MVAKMWAGLTTTLTSSALSFWRRGDAFRLLARQRATAKIRKLGVGKADLVLSDDEVNVASWLVTKDLNVSFEDVGGSEALIGELKEQLLLPLTLPQTNLIHETLPTSSAPPQGRRKKLLAKAALIHPEVVRLTNKFQKGFASDCQDPIAGSSLVSAPLGLLLYGPPGCGKTLLAKAVANHSDGVAFINLDLHSIADKNAIEERKQLSASVFSLARKLQPAIIFIDDIDSFLGANAAMNDQFLRLWDAFDAGPARVVVLAASNRPENIDAAVLRRLSCRLRVAFPGRSQRRDILWAILTMPGAQSPAAEQAPRRPSVPLEADLVSVADATRGFSGADLRELCRRAMLRRVARLLPTNTHHAAAAPLTQAHFDYALATTHILHPCHPHSTAWDTGSSDVD